jgi:hypothetical protein
MMDRIAFLAREEISAESGRRESGAIERLAAEVRKLADRPQPPIKVTVPPPIVNIPEPKPVDVEKLAREISSRLPKPEVVVNIEQPRPRSVRVTEDPETGEKIYIAEELPEP